MGNKDLKSNSRGNSPGWFFQTRPRLFGSSMLAPLRSAKMYLSFLLDFLRFRQRSIENGERFSLRWKDRYACLHDKTSTTPFDRHYVLHTAWAARVLAEAKPESHVDISSFLYFSSLVSAFIPVRYYDYRPANLRLNNLTSEAADLLRLPFENASIKSLSCMHVVEHVGLGRYGDPLEPDGDLKAIAELKRVLAHGGHLLFVVPVGEPKIMFNAHRIYSYDQVMEYFAGLELMEFTLIPDAPEDGGLVRHATKEMASAQTYGCGCFWFTKK